MRPFTTCAKRKNRVRHELLFFIALNIPALGLVGLNLLTIPGYKPDYEAMMAWCVISDLVVNLKGPACHNCPLSEDMDRRPPTQT